MPAGKFSCDACGKAYSWKTELAGRRVKCKCGQTMSVPQDDPAGADDGVGELSALADGGARAGGPTCPSCASPVDPAAVLCINCGTNLKTGQKIKTQKATVAAGAGGAAEVMPGYRSYGAVAKDEPISDQKKKIIMISSLAGLVAVIVIFAVVIIPKANKNRAETAAKDAAARPVLEKVITASEKSGGLTQAMKDGTLYQEVSKIRPPTTPVANVKPPYSELKAYHERILAAPTTKVAKKWILPENHKFVGRTHEESVQLVNQVYGFGCSSVSVLGVVDGGNNTELATGMVATLPTDKDARKKIFAWYHSLDRTAEQIDLPPQDEMGQPYLSIEFKE